MYLQSQDSGARSLQASSPDSRISIYDGVEPSPDLMKDIQSPPAAAATTTDAELVPLKPEKSGHNCSSGCIVGKELKLASKF